MTNHTYLIDFSDSLFENNNFAIDLLSALDIRSTLQCFPFLSISGHFPFLVYGNDDLISIESRLSVAHISDYSVIDITHEFDEFGDFLFHKFFK